MPYTLINQTEDYNHIRIQGLISVPDFLALQDMARTGMQSYQGVRVLIELNDFTGWSHESAWEETEFLTADQNHFMRLAFVGDARWRDDVLLFIGQPMRTEQIAFFTPDQFSEAEAWLKQ